MANTMVQHAKVGIPVSQYPPTLANGLSNASSFDASVVQESTSTRFKPLLILCLRLFLEAHLQRKITGHLEIARNVQILWVSMGPKILHSYRTTQRSLGTRIFEVCTPLHAPRTHSCEKWVVLPTKHWSYPLRTLTTTSKTLRKWNPRTLV